MIRYFFLFLLLLSHLKADTAKEQLTPAAGSPQVVNAQDILIEGLSIVDAGRELSSAPREHGITIEIEEKGQDGLVDVLSPFLNQPITNKALREVKSTIEIYFREKVGIYVAAIIPVQEVINNVVVIEILSGRVGSITYEGQRWFRKGQIRRALGVQVGDPINETDFLNAVTWSNKNPFRVTQIVFVPGTNKGTADLTFITKDRFPARVFTGIDNTGFISNGELRLYAGGSWGNALWLGDILFYQYTASDDFFRFQSHVISYTSFLPTKKLLTLFGVYGTIHPDVDPNTESNGTNIQISARYQVPIKPLFGDFRSYIQFGFDWKSISSSLFFLSTTAESTQTSNNAITISQLLVEYEIQRNWEHNLLTFKTTLVGSPAKRWFPNQTTSDYNGLRAGSQVKYFYVRSNISNTYKMESGWVFSTKVRGQVATATLPTSEQFGLGGAKTVRGYYEQQFVADNAICCNGEIFTPPVSLMTNDTTNNFSFLGFIDYGYGYNYSFLTEDFEQQHLFGAGLGARYNIGRYLNCQVDYGFKLINQEDSPRFGRFNFSFTASY